MVNRLYLNGPMELADRILAAIDEDGLLQKQRIEDSTAEQAAALAQEVLLKEGLPDEIETMPKKVRSRKRNKTAVATEPEACDVDTWIMRRDASEALRKLHEDLDQLKGEKAELTQRLRDAVGSNTLSLRWSPSNGHICHVRGNVSQKALEELGLTKSASSTKTTRSFYLPAWSELGARIDQVKSKIRREEQRIFEDLRREVILNLVKIRRNAAVMDELDVACSFAILAEEQFG